MSNFLKTRISERERQIQECATREANLDAEKVQIAQRRLVLEAELGAYKDALEHQVKEVEKPQSTNSTKRHQEASVKGHSLSPQWRRVMSEMVMLYPRPFGYPELNQILASGGHKIKGATVRKQMQAFIANGYVERVKDGQFRATEQGAAKVGKKLNIEFFSHKSENKPPAPEGASGLPKRGDEGGASSAFESRDIAHNEVFD